MLGAIASYVLAVGFQPSVVRAGIAGALASLAWLAARPRDRWYFLLVAAIALLAWNPYNLLEPGLSALVRRGLRDLRPRPAHRAADSRAIRCRALLATPLAVSTACGLCTAPLLWLDFGRVPVYSVLAQCAGRAGDAVSARARADLRGRPPDPARCRREPRLDQRMVRRLPGVVRAPRRRAPPRAGFVTQGAAAPRRCRASSPGCATRLRRPRLRRAGELCCGRPRCRARLEAPRVTAALFLPGRGVRAQARLPPLRHRPAEDRGGAPAAPRASGRRRSEVLSAADTSGEDAVAACNAPGLFAVGGRAVVVQHVESWKAADVKAVTAYLADPAPSTVLALVGSGIKKDSPLAKACAKTGELLFYDVPKSKLSELGGRALPRAGWKRGSRCLPPARRPRRRQRDRARDRDPEARDLGGRRDRGRRRGGGSGRRPSGDSDLQPDGRVGSARRPCGAPRARIDPRAAGEDAPGRGHAGLGPIRRPRPDRPRGAGPGS